MITKDKNKLAQTFRELPIAKLIRIAHGNYTYDLEIAVEIAGDIIAERQKEVISFFQKMGPFELFSNLILPDFKKYNPATFIGIKQVFLERKREMYKQLKIMDDAFKASEEIIREMEEALRCNFEYPSEKQRLELGVAGIKEKGGWFYNLFRKYAKHKLQKSANKPPKKLDKDSRRLLEEEVDKKKKGIVYWDEKIKPMMLKLLKTNTVNG